VKWTRRVAIFAWLAALAAAVFVVSCARKQSEPQAMTPEEKVARGRRLVYASACIDCHTPGTFYGVPDTTRFMSGSELGWVGPWGVTYPPNLTPHATGIVDWTDEQIAIAIREGRRPDNSPILPPMPWPAYGVGLTHEDALAIAAFLKSLPPIEHQVPDRVAPGGTPTTPVISFPPPPEWDGRNLPPTPSP
jgi:mono/diheme cytochrome c family protein